MTVQEIYNLAIYMLDDETGVSTNQNALPMAKGIALLNQGINEACRRSRLLTDRTTAAICQIPIVAGTGAYTLDARIIKVISARLVTAARELERTYVEDINCEDELWETRTGSPYKYISDYETGKIGIYPTPTTNDTLKLYVSRLPLTPITLRTETPEINARFHPALAHYLVYRVHSMNDTDTYNLKKAQLSLAEFEAEFGPKRSAWSETYENTQPYPSDE